MIWNSSRLKRSTLHFSRSPLSPISPLATPPMKSQPLCVRTSPHPRLIPSYVLFRYQLISKCDFCLFLFVFSHLFSLTLLRKYRVYATNSTPGTSGRRDSNIFTFEAKYLIKAVTVYLDLSINGFFVSKAAESHDPLTFCAQHASVDRWRLRRFGLERVQWDNELHLQFGWNLSGM